MFRVTRAWTWSGYLSLSLASKQGSPKNSAAVGWALVVLSAVDGPESGCPGVFSVQ